MQTLRVNGYDMAYLDVGEGPPLVCVHGTLGDFRTWYSVLGPLSKKHRVIAMSLRHFFPEHWNGIGEDYKMAQHVADMIAFIKSGSTQGAKYGTQGQGSGRMPGFGNMLTDEQISAIVQYVRSL